MGELKPGSTPAFWFWRNNGRFGGADSAVLLYSHQLPALRVSARVKYNPGLGLRLLRRVCGLISSLGRNARRWSVAVSIAAAVAVGSCRCVCVLV